MSALMKDIIRDMKHSKGRFIAISMIMALGVLLFTGVKTAPIDMKYNADKFYDDSNFMDIRVMSTLGLTDEDLSDIRKIEGVKDVVSSKFIDTIALLNNEEFVIRTHSLSNAVNGAGGSINDLRIIEGRLPESKDECVVGEEKFEKLGLKIGDEITLTSGTDEDLADSLETTKFTVVGVVSTPFYLNTTLGNTTIGSGTVNQYIYIKEDNFKKDVYTDIFVTVEGAKDLDSYKDEYFNIVDKVKEDIEGLSDVMIDRRYAIVKAEAEKTLEENKTMFESERQKAYSKLNEAEKQILDGEAEIASGKQTLANKEIEINNLMESSSNQLNLAESELNKKEEEYASNLEAFNSAKSSAEIIIGAAESSISYGKANIQTLVNKKNDLQAKIDAGLITGAEKIVAEGEIKGLELSIKSLEEEILKSEAEVQAQKDQLIQAENQLTNGRKQLDAAWAELNNKKAELENGRASAVSEIDSMKSLLESNESKIISARAEYEKNKKEVEGKLKESEEKLLKAEDEVAAIDKPSLYVLTRKQHFPYVDYENSADSINKLSNVFPVFFFIVAALVCSTTMTRMVDEERINIGTLKALGYSKGAIMKKFVIYALFATGIGSIIGLIGGFTVLPMVIYNAYNIMYSLPAMEIRVSIPIAIMVASTAIAVTLASTLSACKHDLKEAPATLMVPKAPKSGKRILLEYIPFIWNRLGFIGKVTLRNIFRYKKRFFMTVLGISGSTALLLAGFGIKDSIGTVVSNQYEDIYKYQLTFNIDGTITNKEKDNLYEYLESDTNIYDFGLVSKTAAQIVEGDSVRDVNLIVSPDSETLLKFIKLRDRKTLEPVELNDSGAVITEKLASKLGVKVGDKVSLKNHDGITKEILVTGITENYVQHYVYMTLNYYSDVFESPVSNNSGFITLSQGDEDAKVKLVSSELTGKPGISGVINNESLKSTFSDTIKSLDFVIFVMILCAGALSFTVLYNLTNLNISERIREIATIKVLGFYNSEVSMYIFRENMILTIVGLLVGLGLGVVFHRFIITTVEMDYIMFGRSVKLMSFLYASIMTFIFSAIVNFAMYFKLKNVKMVESLKSVE